MILRKALSILFALALVVVPFGGAFATEKPYKVSVEVEKNDEAKSISATGTVTHTKHLSSRDQLPDKVHGDFTFTLITKSKEQVDSKSVNVPRSEGKLSASTSFENVEPGDYYILVEFKGHIRTKGGDWIKDKSLRGRAPVSIEGKPGDGDGGNGGDDDGNGGGNDDGNNGGNDGNGGNGGNDNAQDGNDNKGDDNGKGGKVTNPGSPQGGQLPKTATSYPTSALIGSGILAAGVGLLLYRRRQSA